LRAPCAPPIVVVVGPFDFDNDNDKDNESAMCFRRAMPPRSASPVHFLLGLASRYPERIIRGLVMAVAGTLLTFVVPNTARWIIDEVIPHRDLDRLRSVVLFTLGAMLLRQFLYTLRTLANNEFHLRMTFDLRARLHEKVQLLPIQWFDHQSTGDTITRMSDDVPATQRAILDAVDQCVPAILQIVITIVIMHSIHGMLTLVAFLPLPFIAFGAWGFGRWIFPRELKAREAAGGLASVLSDNVAGIRQIKSFTMEAAKQRVFEASSARYKEMQTSLQRAWSIYGPAMGFVGDVGVLLVMGCGALWCIAGELTVGELGQFLLLMGLLFDPLARMNALATSFVGSAAAAQRVIDVLEMEGAEDLDAGHDLEEVRGEIRFVGVGFHHVPERPTVTGLDLAVEPGQTVALVGATGAGKSTTFQLLTRFYEPDEGEILLDGRPIRDLSKKSLRDAIAYVTQESYLFNESIRDNLKAGKTDATDEELWDALDAACAREFVERLDGQLGANVGERGGRLSGGEKQRIAIARAFLKDAPILLLDEATSAVDAKSEELIKRAIDRLRENRTCLVIAHRLSTVRDADRIYVMQEGRIIGQGSHSDLMATNATYAELARLSLSGGAALDSVSSSSG